MLQGKYENVIMMYEKLKEKHENTIYQTLRKLHWVINYVYPENDKKSLSCIVLPFPLETGGVNAFCVSYIDTPLPVRCELLFNLVNYI